MLMRDSIEAPLIPTDTPVVAGYGDGLYNWSPSWRNGSNWWDLFPNSIKLVIVVSAAHSGDILDVETGDAAPADVPGWVMRFNRPGRRKPTIYCNRGTWVTVQSVLRVAGMDKSLVDWWAATLDGTQDVPGAVAVQYVDTGAYDESVILDPSWVGLEDDMWDASDPLYQDMRQAIRNLEAVAKKTDERFLGDLPPSGGAGWGAVSATVLQDDQTLQQISAQNQAAKAELDIIQADIAKGIQVTTNEVITRLKAALANA